MALTQVQNGMIAGVIPASLGGTGTTAGVTGFKNRLINGDMGIWQRGTSFSSAVGNYTADRWKNDQSNTVVQSSDVPTGLTQYSLDVTQGVSSYGTFVQNIEAANCNDLVSKSVTVSFWAKNISGSLSLNVLLRHANSINNFSSLTNFAGITLSANPSTSWTYYTATFNNLPSGVANGLQVGIYRDIGAAQTRYTLIQLEQGSSATNFDYLPFGTELMLCQRYYQFYGGVSYSGIAAGMINNTNTKANIAMSFCTVMRASPALSFSNLIVTDRTAYDTAVSSVAFAIMSPNGFFSQFNLASTAGGSGTGTLLCVTNGTTGTLVFDAEL